MDATTSPAPTRELSHIEIALEIADQLVEQAIWAGQTACTFTGAGTPAAADEPAPYQTVDASFYDGTAGIARFLYLADRYAPGRYRSTATGAIHHALATTQGFSLFSGSLGVAVIALEGGQDQFRDHAEQAVADSILQAASNGDLAPADLLAGLAGVIVGLDAALEYARTEAQRSAWIDAMVDFGFTLQRTARSNGFGYSWPVYPGSTDHLCGLAHGASGVAYAMQKLDSRAPERGPWRDIASQARSWERLHFSQAQGSWADLRTDPDVGDEAAEMQEPICPHMWCHGSIGITLERLSADRSDEMAAVDCVAGVEALRYSAQSVIAAPRGAAGSHANNGSQCHGIAGSIDALIEVAGVAHDPEPFMSLARDAARAMCDDATSTGRWRCGVPNAPETPGLMTGLAGIGWSLLRLADPGSVRSAWRLI